MTAWSDCTQLASGLSESGVLCISEKLRGHGIILLHLHYDPFIIKMHLASGTLHVGLKGAVPQALMTLP